MTSAELLVVVLLALLVIVSWFPFRLDLPFRAGEVSTSESGVWTFSGRELASSAAPPTWLDEAIGGSLLEVSLEVRSTSVDQGGPARILSLSRDTSEQNLMIGQEEADLVVRVRPPGASDLGEPALEVADVFATSAWRSLQVRLDDRRVRVAVDGVVVASEEVRDTFRSWDEEHWLSLGNERGWDRGWEGAIRVAEVQSPEGRTDVLASDLQTGWDRRWVWPDRLTSERDRPWSTSLATWALHVLIGVAMVLAALRAWPRLSARCVALTWTAVVVVVNLGKVAIDLRHPSLVTTLLQLFGGSLALAYLFNVERPTRPNVPPTAS